MIPTLQAKTALEAYQKAWAILASTWSEMRMAAFLTKAVLIDYKDGAFTFQVPTAAIAALMNRRAENLLIKQALELYIPPHITVSVTVVTEEVQP